MTTRALEALQGRVRGPVITAMDSGYDEARRVYNAMIDARPQAVVRCTTAQDVAAVVRYAGETGTELAVRGGGHSVPGFGTADGAVVADLAGMRSVTVDPDQRLGRAAGGATWGGFNDTTARHGLATTGGIVSTTGVGGLTLGGGIGYLSRGYGLSCDNLLSAQVVTADGTLLTASEHEHPDLYWSLRGGGGNFGVVTEFTYRLHPVSDIYGGPMFFELSDAPAVLAYFREVIADAPREYGGFPAFQIAPPLPFVPPDRIGDTFLAVVSCWTGSVAEGERMVQGFRDVAPTVAEHVGVMPYAALNSAFDGLYPPGLQHYWKACFVTELTDAAIAAHISTVRACRWSTPRRTSTRSTVPATMWRRRRRRLGPATPRSPPSSPARGRIRPTTGRTPPGSRSTTPRSPRTRSPVAMSTSRPGMTSREWWRTTAATTRGCWRQSGAMTRTTCSTSTKTSSRERCSVGATT